MSSEVDIMSLLSCINFFHLNYWLLVTGIVCYKVSVTVISKKHFKETKFNKFCFNYYFELRDQMRKIISTGV